MIKLNNNCGTCGHSCKIQEGNEDEKYLVCLNGTSPLLLNKVGQNDEHECWEKSIFDEFDDKN